MKRSSLKRTAWNRQSTIASRRTDRRDVAYQDTQSAPGVIADDVAAKINATCDAVLKPRKRPQRSRPKMTPARKNARGQDCTVCFPGCPNDRDTTVLCHLRMFNGGGTGIKPHDSEAVFADDYCHGRLDGRVPLWLEPHESRFDYIAHALIRTLRAQRDAGVLLYKGEE